MLATSTFIPIGYVACTNGPAFSPFVMPRRASSFSASLSPTPARGGFWLPHWPRPAPNSQSYA